MNFLDASTTPQTLLASLAAGIQTTGAQVWPLLVLVGVPLAFVVAGFVISFIRDTISPRMSQGPEGYYRAGKGGGEARWDIDQKGAKERYDLEHKGFTEF